MSGISPLSSLQCTDAVDCVTVTASGQRLSYSRLNPTTSRSRKELSTYLQVNTVKSSGRSTLYGISPLTSLQCIDAVDWITKMASGQRFSYGRLNPTTSGFSLTSVIWSFHNGCQVNLSRLLDLGIFIGWMPLRLPNQWCHCLKAYPFTAQLHSL